MEELKNLKNKNRLRVFTIEKIKLAEKPDLKKYFKEFFQNPKLYFNNQFDNKQLVIGKSKTQMEKYEIPIPKKFQRKYGFRKKTRTYRLDNDNLSEQLSLFNEKRRHYKGSKDYTLKEGQRYINDRELEDIFKAFQKVHEINKTKNKDFITTKELIDSIFIYHDDDKKRNNNNNFKSELSINKNYERNNHKNKEKNEDKLSKSKSSLFGEIKNTNPLLLHDSFNKINSNKNIKNREKSSRIKSSYSQSYFQYNQNRLIPKIKLQNNQYQKEFEDTLGKINNIDNISTVNTQITIMNKNRPQSFLTKFTNSNIQLLEDKEKEKIKKQLLENEKLMEKQTQFLPNTSQELIKKEIAKRLASQEKALIYNLKFKNKENNLLEHLSKKLKKQKSSLMLGQIEDYRLIKDIKVKINRLIKKTNPGQNYNWQMDLRNSRNEDKEKTPKMINNEINNNKKISLSQDEEITRNPCYKTFYLTNKKFRKHEKDYIKSKVPKRSYIQFINDINNLQKNYDGFLIEGKNLLKHEHDLIKKIKGKKIINKYDNFFQAQDINNELYANNFNILKVNKF